MNDTQLLVIIKAVAGHMVSRHLRDEGFTDVAAAIDHILNSPETISLHEEQVDIDAFDAAASQTQEVQRADLGSYTSDDIRAARRANGQRRPR